MAQIAKASNIPTIELMKDISKSLIRVSNAYLVKVRNPKASGGIVRKDANLNKQIKPIAAYFPVAPETMSAELNQLGHIVRWKHELPDGRYMIFSIDDIVHFTLDRREGFLFGVPSIVPVIDDIRALRQIEENIEMLLYQNLFPLFQYKVGTETRPAGLAEDGQKEVDIVRDELRNMPLEGGIVTPERHDIKAVGSEGRALRAEGYLDHFKKRVIAGLGVSSIDLGDGNTVNRGTANSLSRALIDTVKDIQDTLEAQWDQKIFSELLLESTFPGDVLGEENMVHLSFEEIDIANRMELEKHYIELFEANGLTFDEFRSELHLEPIQVPEHGDDQDPTKYPEWFNTYWKLFEEPLNLIKAVTDPLSVASQANAAARSTNTTTKSLGVAQKAKEETEKRAQEAKKTVAVAKKKATDHFLDTAYKSLGQELLTKLKEAWEERGTFDADYMKSYARTWASYTSQQFKTVSEANLRKGFQEQLTSKQYYQSIKVLNGARDVVDERVEYFITRLAISVVDLIQRRINKVQVSNISNMLAAINNEAKLALDSLAYRVDLIYNTELEKSYNYGKMLGLKVAGTNQVMFITTKTDACEKCKSHANEKYDIITLGIHDIVPLHPNCKCSLMPASNK